MWAQKTSIGIFWFLSLCLFWHIEPLIQAQKTPETATVYSFGVVPQFDARRIKAVWRPVLDLVEKKARVSLRLEGAPSIPDFEKAFESGAYDFAYMNPYHALVANASQGYLPLIRDERNALYGIIVVKKDSPIANVRELNGKTVAFPAPNALGACLIPRAEFQRTFGISIIPKYVRSHTSVYLNVFLNQADAGGGIRKTLDQQKPELQNGLRVLYRTPEVSTHPIVVHPRVPKSIQLAVQQAFLQIGNSPNGADLLTKIPIFQTGEARLEDYQLLQAMDLEKFYVSD